MQWSPKDIIVLFLVVGIMVVLALLTYDMHSATDPKHASEVVTVIKMTVTGLIGVVAGFFGGRSSK